MTTGESPQGPKKKPTRTAVFNGADNDRIDRAMKQVTGPLQPKSAFQDVIDAMEKFENLSTPFIDQVTAVSAAGAVAYPESSLIEKLAKVPPSSPVLAPEILMNPELRVARRQESLMQNMIELQAATLKSLADQEAATREREDVRAAEAAAQRVLNEKERSFNARYMIATFVVVVVTAVLTAVALWLPRN